MQLDSLKKAKVAGAQDHLRFPHSMQYRFPPSTVLQHWQMLLIRDHAPSHSFTITLGTPTLMEKERKARMRTSLFNN